MAIKKVSSASVYYRHDCWNHRYAKVCDNGRKEYGSISGFDDEVSATESFWKYLNEYREKLEEIKESQKKLQQELYDEEENIDITNEKIIEEELDDEE